MKIILPFSLLLIPILLSAQGTQKTKKNIDAYNIRIQLKPYKDQMVGFGHYFGSDFIVTDSAILNENSEAVFRGVSALPGGIYLAFVSGQNIVLNFLVDKQQHFSIIADLRDSLTPGLKFYDSPENEAFYKYKQFKSGKENEIMQAQYDLAAAINKEDSAIVTRRLKDIEKDINHYRDDIIQQNSGTFLSALLVALREPQLPGNLSEPKNATDTAAQRAFIKNHFWDGVYFWDGRLAYTTFFAGKLDKYFTEILEQQSDSVIKQTDKMMAFAANNESMSQLLLSKLLYGSMYHHYKWEDTVFIHLFENFIAGKNYNWLLDEERRLITERAYFLMGNIKGKKAPDIELPGTDNNMISLQKTGATFTLICFWDPTCHHCRETLPEMDSIYKAKWKRAGIKFFSVAVETEGNRDDWLNFIHTHQLQDWINVYNSIDNNKMLTEAGKTTCLQDYDVWYYPSFYLLDKDKHYMARKLSWKQIKELVNTIIKDK
ncbi:MAG: redoxin domain-containing protein [Ferruginibacter sp.]